MNFICLVAGLLIMPVGEAVTLRWTHSIQKTLWEEDYRLQGGTLIVESARIQSTGAGMEVPDGASFRDGAWHYKPELPPLPELQLRHSPYVAPYTLCSQGICKTAAEWLPGLPEEAILSLLPCPSESGDDQPPEKMVTMPP